jgi:spermidine/putrescine transport system permease protein
MIPSIHTSAQSKALRITYLSVFFLLLFLPLCMVVLFAFNDANYPLPPWKGFTLDWFFAHGDSPRTGLLFDEEIRGSLGISCIIAVSVSLLSVAVGTANAFLLERCEFRGKRLFSIMILLPMVIPGVILGISILAFMSRIAAFVDTTWDVELECLRPGMVLIILGQCSYIISIATLTISARLKRFDIALEEAAQNLGASRAAIFFTISLPYLLPAMIGAGAMAFLLSFENFNTTYMLSGSDAPLTVLMYGRMKEGATPVLNAISLGLMLMSSLIVALLYLRKPRTP